MCVVCVCVCVYRLVFWFNAMLQNYAAFHLQAGIFDPRTHRLTNTFCCHCCPILGPPSCTTDWQASTFGCSCSSGGAGFFFARIADKGCYYMAVALLPSLQDIVHIVWLCRAWAYTQAGETVSTLRDAAGQPAQRRV